MLSLVPGPSPPPPSPLLPLASDHSPPLLSVRLLTTAAACFLLLHRIASNILEVDVGDMNSDLKLRGVKRRLESSAAAAAAAGLRVKQLNSGPHHRPGSPVPLSSSSSAAAALPAKVLSSPVACIESLSLSKIRQLVFNLSMCKLSRYRQTADPSLVRSVLICNTLKRLERELDREGIKINFGPNGVSFVPPPSNFGTPMLLNHNNHSSSPAPTPPQQSPPLSVPASESSDIKLLSSVESSVSESEATATKFSLQESSPSGRLTPFLREDDEPVDHQPVLSLRDDDDDDSGLWSPDAAHRLSSSSWTETMSFTSGDVSNDSTIADIERPDTESASAPVVSSSILLHELRPPAAAAAVTASSGTGVLRSEVTSVKAGVRCNKTLAMDTSASASASCSSASSSSSTSSSTTEEIFGDIDLSLYDFDLLSPIAAPNVKLSPVSAEELMRSVTPAPDDTTPSHPSISVHIASAAAAAPSPPPAPVLPSASSASCPSTSCATQSTASVVFSKLFISKKDPLFLDEMPTAIS